MKNIRLQSKSWASLQKPAHLSGLTPMQKQIIAPEKSLITALDSSILPRFHQQYLMIPRQYCGLM